MSLADKINQLSLIKEKFKGLGARYDTDSLKNEWDTVHHYMKMFRVNDDMDHMLDVNRQIQDLIADYKETSRRVTGYVDTVLHKKELNILQDDYRRFEADHITLEHIQARQQYMSEEFVTEIDEVSRAYGDWRFGGCIVNPIDGLFSDCVIGCDPLYLSLIHI